MIDWRQIRYTAATEPMKRETKTGNNPDCRVFIRLIAAPRTARIITVIERYTRVETKLLNANLMLLFMQEK